MLRWGAIAAIILWLGAWAPAAGASSLLCRQADGHRVCLESVKRSAKYSWEYRAVTTVDGQRQPLQRYDCRQSTAGAAGGADPGDTASGGTAADAAGVAPADAPPALDGELRTFICERVHR